MSASIEKAVYDLVEPIAKEEGLGLLDVQWISGEGVLRIYLEKEEGAVTLDDCARVSHAIEDILDVKGIVPARYHLEVSSPGVNRPLKRRPHFQKVLGQTIRLRTHKAIDGRRNYKGILKQADGDLVMEIDRQEVRIPMDLVEKANLEAP